MTIVKPHQELTHPFDRSFDKRNVTARDGNGVVAMIDEKLHVARFGDDLLHMPEIDQESPVASDNHRIGTQFVFHLLGCSAQHI